MANKVKFGLKNVYFAKATIDEATNTATYGTPVRWPGAVNLSLDAEGGTNKFRADNIDYYVSQTNNGYSGDFESALIPDAFRTEILGDVVDENGVQIEDAGAQTVQFALIFQFEGDQNAVRHVLYNCTATRPAINGQTTEEETEPNTETLTITAVAIHNATLDKNIVKAKVGADNASVYAAWFNAVYQPTAVATYHTVSFDTDGGTAIADQSVRNGQTATRPTDPTKSGYTFGGWYEEDTFTTEFDFTTPITADTTIYAKFTT